MSNFWGALQIENGAFLNCHSLTSVRIPASLVRDGFFDESGYRNDITYYHQDHYYSHFGKIFENCKSLTSVQIASGTTEIGNYAFSRCDTLTNINIPSSVTKIGRNAFNKCTNLKRIDIPSSVTDLDKDAFGGSNLTDVSLPARFRGKVNFPENCNVEWTN